MITIKNETISGIPTLHVVQDEKREQGELPAVFFLHGYTSAKEHNLAIAYLLAEKGFRVFLPDAIYHGEREGNFTGKERDLLFWEVVLTSIQDLNKLKEHYSEQKLIDLNRVGVSGTSMGAITTYGALTQYKWIQSAVCFMGAAYFQKLAHEQMNQLEQKGIVLEEEAKADVLAKIRPFDLSYQVEKLNQRPLLIWHGKQDKVVPFAFSEELYHDIQPHYQDTPQWLEFSIEERSGHKVPRQAILEAVSWFEAHLLTKRRRVS